MSGSLRLAFAEFWVDRAMGELRFSWPCESDRIQFTGLVVDCKSPSGRAVNLHGCFKVRCPQVEQALVRVTVEYGAQLKRAAGVASEPLEVAENCSLGELLQQAAELRGGSLKKLLFNADGELHPSILLFVCDEQVRSGSSTRLKDCDVVTVLSPISGG